MERYRSDPEYRSRIRAKVNRRAALSGSGNRKVRDILAMIERDGIACAECDGILVNPFDGSEVHVDHIVPASKGGSDNLSNRRLLHAVCNLRRGNRV